MAKWSLCWLCLALLVSQFSRVQRRKESDIETFCPHLEVCCVFREQDSLGFHYSPATSVTAVVFKLIQCPRPGQRQQVDRHGSPHVSATWTRTRHRQVPSSSSSYSGRICWALLSIMRVAECRDFVASWTAVGPAFQLRMSSRALITAGCFLWCVTAWTSNPHFSFYVVYQDFFHRFTRDFVWHHAVATVNRCSYICGNTQ